MAQKYDFSNPCSVCFFQQRQNNVRICKIFGQKKPALSKPVF